MLIFERLPTVIMKGTLVSRQFHYKILCELVGFYRQLNLFAYEQHFELKTHPLIKDTLVLVPY